MKENKVLYYIVNFYVKTCLHFFYKKVAVVGLENIPKNRPVIFVANHQNAMMDPILIGTHNSRSLYFLARASAFKNIIAKKLLNAIHAIAIYRFRDGKEKVKNNELVFEKCTQLLEENKCILLFPEGSHHIERKIRPLRGGFVRMAHDFMKANPSKELLIIPIGLNYTNTIHYGESVKLIYGKPVSLINFDLVGDKINATKRLIEVVEEKFKNITVHIDSENYYEIVGNIPKEDFLNPKKTNKKISDSYYKSEIENDKNFNFLYFLVKINSVIPYLLWLKIRPKIKAVEFTSTFKISLGMTVFPLFYILQAILISSFYGTKIAFLYLILSVLLVWVCTKNK